MSLSKSSYTPSNVAIVPRHSNKDIDLGQLMLKELMAWSIRCTKEGRAEWFRLLRETGDPKYRELIQRSVVRWVIKLAHRCVRVVGIDRSHLSDLVQEGFIGVDRAMDSFDSELKVSFLTYATFWIERSMQRFFEDKVHTVRLPVHRHRLLREIGKARGEVERRLNAPALGVAVARELGMSEEELCKFYVPRTLPLDTVIAVNHVEDWEEILLDESPVTLESVLVDASSPLPDDVAIQRIDSERMLKELRQVIRNQFREQFKERAVTVFFCRYGLGGEEPQTLEALGCRFGITKEAVRQICVRIEKKLRHPANRRFVVLIRH